MTDLAFVDTHVHFYDLGHPTLEYSWLDPELDHPVIGNIDAVKSRQYRPEDFLAESRFNNVSKVIHVQAALGSKDPVVETQWLSEAFARTGIPHGIIAHADLKADDLDEQLDRHSQFGGFRGIRDFSHGDYLVDERYRHGIQTLGVRGLVASIDCLPETYGRVADLAAAAPETVLCIDHCGFPRQRGDDYFAFWKREMAAIAAQPNTFIKISGLGMVDQQWTIDSIRPWVETSIELFGVDRTVFGSNWPLDRLFSSYTDLIHAYRSLIGGYAPHEQVALFSGNAERIYAI
ncbi:amidohydrolase family protein [Rhodoglobus sp.]